MPSVPFDGTFTVAGNHVYNSQPTPYVVTTTVSDAGGSQQTVTSNLTIPSGILTPSIVPLDPAPHEGIRFNAVLASFQDTNPNASPGQFSARIFWGDGTSSAGFVLPGTPVVPPVGGSTDLPPSVFDIRGTHLYFAGDYNIDVYVTEAGGGQTEAHTSLTVNPANVTATALTNLVGVEGRAFTDPIATFISDSARSPSTDELRRPSTGATIRTMSSPPSPRRPSRASSSSPGRTNSTTDRTTRSR